MEKIGVLVLVLLVYSAGCENLTVTEQECISCVSNGTRVFLKLQFTPLSVAPTYWCRKSALFASQFGAIVERVCAAENCKGIEHRPITRTYQGNELSCHGSPAPETTSSLDLLSTIRECMEIIFMVVVMSLLLIKKSLIENCVQKNIGKLFSKPNNRNMVETIPL